MTQNTALLLIDIQNDFCKTGSLAVPHADEIIVIANQLMPFFSTIVATQDWHPAHHMSFASSHPLKKPGDCMMTAQGSQILWPDHCLQHSHGAQLHPALHSEKITRIFYKGTDQTIDSYSAFYDNHHLKSTGLTQWLRQKNIDTLYVMGLATDYCVQYSCLDAVMDQFSVHLIVDGCRGVNLQKNDIENALLAMQNKGVSLTHSQDLIL